MKNRLYALAITILYLAAGCVPLPEAPPANAADAVARVTQQAWELSGTSTAVSVMQRAATGTAIIGTARAENHHATQTQEMIDFANDQATGTAASATQQAQAALNVFNTQQAEAEATATQQANEQATAVQAVQSTLISGQATATAEAEARAEVKSNVIGALVVVLCTGLAILGIWFAWRLSQAKLRKANLILDARGNPTHQLINTKDGLTVIDLQRSAAPHFTVQRDGQILVPPGLDAQAQAEYLYQLTMIELVKAASQRGAVDLQTMQDIMNKARQNSTAEAPAEAVHALPANIVPVPPDDQRVSTWVQETINDQVIEGMSK